MFLVNIETTAVTVFFCCCCCSVAGDTVASDMIIFLHVPSSSHVVGVEECSVFLGLLISQPPAQPLITGRQALCPSTFQPTRDGGGNFSICPSDRQDNWLSVTFSWREKQVFPQVAVLIKCCHTKHLGQEQTRGHWTLGEEIQCNLIPGLFRDVTVEDQHREYGGK